VGKTGGRPQAGVPARPGVQQHNVDVIACLVDQYRRWTRSFSTTTSSSTSTVLLRQVQGQFHDYCRRTARMNVPAALDEFWKAEVRVFVARCVQPVPHAASRSALARAGHGRAQREGAGLPRRDGVRVPGLDRLFDRAADARGKGYVKMLWAWIAARRTLRRRPSRRSGRIPSVGFWLFFDKVEGTRRTGAAASRTKAASARGAGTFDAVATAFSTLTDGSTIPRQHPQWRRALRSALGRVKADSLTVTIKNTGSA